MRVCEKERERVGVCVRVSVSKGKRDGMRDDNRLNFG